MATTITDSVSTAATTRPKVDYISALNAGSGLNTTQIVDTLVEAEILPKQNKINEQVEEKNVSISSLGQVKNDFTSFDTNLAILADQNTIVTASSSTAITLTPDSTTALKPFVHNMTISTLAKAHTLAFPSYSTANAVFDSSGHADTVIFGVGSYSGDTFSRDTNIALQSISITGTTTIQDVASQINSLTSTGLSASVLKTGDASFSLVIKSGLGANKKINMSAQDTNNSNGIGANNVIAAVSYTTPSNSTHAAKQVVAGVDSAFTFDGISITRPTNVIADLVPGVSLELNATSATDIEVGAAHDETQALDILTAFVTEVNTLRTSMTNMTDMGAEGGDGGPLRGDTLIRSYINRLRSITTTPISNYKDDPIYLSNFGVMTELDGSLSIDTLKFSDYFKSNPSDFAALTKNRVTSGNALIQATGTGSLYKAGTYDLSLTSSDNRQSFTAATFDGAAMVLENGTFKGDSTNTLGINIVAASGAPDTRIFIGNSLISSLREFSKSVLTPGNAIDSKISTYSDEITGYEDELAKLETAMETTRARYAEQFAAMESAVSSFKKTGEYLDNFMEGWKAGLG
ncbi:flagellar filament capping protein FliD [Alphaproteobacteria bacterium]|nr:flagellar filament capping protein FliD [Alphaproteobacteria bacterium]